MFMNNNQLLEWKYWEQYDKSYQEFLSLYDYKEEHDKVDEEAEEHLAWQREEEQYAHYMDQVTSERFFIDNVLDGDEDYSWNLD